MLWNLDSHLFYLRINFSCFFIAFNFVLFRCKDKADSFGS